MRQSSHYRTIPCRGWVVNSVTWQRDLALLTSPVVVLLTAIGSDEPNKVYRAISWIVKRSLSQRLNLLQQDVNNKRVRSDLVGSPHSSYILYVYLNTYMYARGNDRMLRTGMSLSTSPYVTGSPTHMRHTQSPVIVGYGALVYSIQW